MRGEKSFRKDVVQYECEQKTTKKIADFILWNTLKKAWIRKD